MTNDEYSQLIEFLGRKFEEINRRFDRVEAKLEVHDRRFDAVEAKSLSGNNVDTQHVS